MSNVTQALFHTILNMSLTSSVVIVAVLFLRLVLKKTPKVFSYALWFLVLFRLLCPVTLESPVSIFRLLEEKNSTNSVMEPVPYDIGYQAVPEVNLYIPPVTASVNQSLPAAAPYASINPMQVLLFLAELVWTFGLFLLLITGILSGLRLKFRLCTACRIKENIYQTGEFSSPFVYGLFSPRIYLPASLSPAETEYIILHEKTHIKRLDHFTKLLWHITLCIHWFNPLVWLAFRLMERDMEMSCDEAVLKAMGEGIKADYSSSLFQMSQRKSPGRTHFINPLAFGETGLKARIKNILTYKRPVIWMTSVSITIILLVAVTLLTNPKTDKDTEPDGLPPLNNQAAADTITTMPVETADTDNSNSTVGAAYTVVSVNRTAGVLSENAEYTISSYEQKNCIDLLILRLVAVSYIRPAVDLETLDNYIRIRITGKDYASYYDYYVFVKDGTPYIQGGIVGNNIPIPLKDYLIFSCLISPDAETEKVVEDNIHRMLLSSLPYSDISSYMKSSPVAYDTILKYGDKALAYMLTCFQKGEGDTLKGQIMMVLCNEILGDRLYTGTQSTSPTEWFRTLNIVPATALPDYAYEGEDAILKLVYDTEIQMRRDESRGFLVTAPHIFGYYEEGNLLKVFATVYYSYYKLYSLKLSNEGGGVIPEAITFTKNSDGSYTLKSYEEAEDGSYFNSSIKKFCAMPLSGDTIPGLADKILSSYGNTEDLQELMASNLQEHLKKYGYENVTIDSETN